MERHNEILNNINRRYVLLKDNEEYLIIDKLRRTMVIINDPIIDVMKLIDIMIEKSVEIFNDVNDLPEITEFPIEIEEMPPAFKAFIRKVFNKERRETGAIISAMTESRIGREEKLKIERTIQHYASQVLYPNERLNLYSSIHDDTA